MRLIQKQPASELVVFSRDHGSTRNCAARDEAELQFRISPGRAASGLDPPTPGCANVFRSRAAGNYAEDVPGVAPRLLRDPRAS